MVSTPEGFTDNSLRYPMIPTLVKKAIVIKSLCLFTNILYLKNKTAIHRVGDAKSKRKAIISKRKGNSKINNQIKKYLYNWIMHHPQVVQSPIFNYCLKLNIDGHTEP